MQLKDEIRIKTWFLTGLLIFLFLFSFNRFNTFFNMMYSILFFLLKSFSDADLFYRFLIIYMISLNEFVPFLLFLFSFIYILIKLRWEGQNFPKLSEVYPEEYDFIKWLSFRVGFLKPPKCLLSPNPVPNAYVYGLSSDNAKLFITTGFLRAYDFQEKQAILYHELFHIKNGDLPFLMIGPVLSTALKIWGLLLIFLSFLMIVYHAIYTGITTSYTISLIQNSLVTFFVFIIIPLGLISSVFKDRELLADEACVQIMESSEPLKAILRDDGKRSFLASIISLFTTHPSPESRLLRLEEISKQGYGFLRYGTYFWITITSTILEKAFADYLGSSQSWIFVLFPLLKSLIVWTLPGIILFIVYLPLHWQIDLGEWRTQGKLFAEIAIFTPILVILNEMLAYRIVPFFGLISIFPKFAFETIGDMSLYLMGAFIILNAAVSIFLHLAVILYFTLKRYFGEKLEKN